MEINLYEFTSATFDQTKQTSPSRLLTAIRFTHLALMGLQLGFWTWIIIDQRSAWERNSLLLTFFISMIATFMIAVFVDCWSIYATIGRAEVYLCVASISLCVVLAAFMANSHSAVIIGMWLLFSAVWASVCLFRITKLPGSDRQYNEHT